ncbi:hemopexin-like, partial [Leptodactylus fuscus]|uniref:hemopexin-like n=1 Tax=Leptodactylus fuscus TaxID=238119 RepID=UPI003F4EA06B
MRVIVSALLCLLPQVLSYPFIKGKRNDTVTNLNSQSDLTDVSGPAGRCTHDGFGAMTLDDKGVMHFFRGDFVWVGPQGPARHINESWPGLSGPIDAAFRNHDTRKPLEHERTFLFK